MTTPYHKRYLASGMRGDAFLPLGADDVAARVHEVSSRQISPIVLEALRKQNGMTLEPQTALVVTGQQVGLFLGPLYTLAKAASAVVWARQLAQQTAVRVRPLFWLQTEDHDFAEIDHCYVPRPGPQAPLRLSMQTSRPSARISVAHRHLDPRIDDTIALLAEALGDKPHAAEVVSAVARHYRAGASLAAAFAGLLKELFPDLLVFDPRCMEIAHLAAPLIERALLASEQIDQALAERTRALRAAGHAEQIHIRGGTPLPFVHDEAGERQRVKAADVPRLLGLLASDPLRFSTSALLRPIVQDTILPTALYVGGPAEVDYFAQAACLYPVFGLAPPLIALRARIRLITPRLAAALDDSGLTPSNLDDDMTVATKIAERLGALGSGPDDAWLGEIDRHLHDFANVAHASPKHVQRARRSMHHALELLRRRYLRAVSTQDASVNDRLLRVRNWLRPDGAPQERVHSFMAFAAQTGLRPLADALIAGIDVRSGVVTDVYL